MFRSTPTTRPIAFVSSFPTPARRWSSRICASPTGSRMAKRRRWFWTARAPKSPRSTRRRSPTMRRRLRPARCATSFTPPARPAIPRASRSRMRASATSCGWRPSATASPRATASIRACRSHSISRSRRSGCRSSPARRWSPTSRPRACSARSWLNSSNRVPSPASAACRPCSRRSSAICRACASCWLAAKPARRRWSSAGPGRDARCSTAMARPKPRSPRPSGS